VAVAIAIILNPEIRALLLLADASSIGVRGLAKSADT
jgi:hypothetical protein